MVTGESRNYLTTDCFLPLSLDDIMNDSTTTAHSMAKMLVEQHEPCPQIIYSALREDDVEAKYDVEETFFQENIFSTTPIAEAEALVPVEQAPTLLSTLTVGEAPVIQDIEAVLADRGLLQDCDEIIPNLYLGAMEAAEDTQRLQEYGICAVVCCNRELEFPSSKFSPQLEYHRVDVEDMGREPIELFFPEATEFIHSQLTQERPVLVHCKAGVSRSSSVVLAYLMEYHRYSLHDAFFLALSRRPHVTPNLGFMDKLRGFEEEILGTPATISSSKYCEWFQTREKRVVPDLRPSA